MEYLSKTDPNILISWLSLLGGVGLWLWHKAKGDKTKSAKGLLDDVVTQVINSPDVNLDNVQSMGEKAARDALAKIGFRGAAAETLVHLAATAASAELHRRFDLMTRNMDAMFKATVAAEKALTPTPGAFPKLEVDIEAVP